MFGSSSEDREPPLGCLRAPLACTDRAYRKPFCLLGRIRWPQPVAPSPLDPQPICFCQRRPLDRNHQSTPILRSRVSQFFVSQAILATAPGLTDASRLKPGCLQPLVQSETISLQHLRPDPMAQLLPMTATTFLRSGCWVGPCPGYHNHSRISHGNGLPLACRWEKTPATDL